MSDEELVSGMLGNLKVDRRLTLATHTHIRSVVTATDVSHTWSVKPLEIKPDATPGRLQRVTPFIQRGIFSG